MKQCKECGGKHRLWWNCPKLDLRKVNYGWAWKQGQNPARREAFLERAAADPFGVTSE